jgi:GAF domain-containing protein
MARPTKQATQITPFTTWLNRKLVDVTDLKTFSSSAKISQSHLSLLRRGQRKPSERKVHDLVAAFKLDVREREEALVAAGYRTDPAATSTISDGLAISASAAAPSTLFAPLDRVVGSVGKACGLSLEVAPPFDRHSRLTGDGSDVSSDIRVAGELLGHVRASNSDLAGSRPSLKMVTAAVASCLTFVVQSERERATIADLALSLSSTGRVENLLCKLLDGIAELIEFDFGHITLVDTENQELVVLAEKCRPESAVPVSDLRTTLSPARWKMSSGVTGRAATTGLPTRVPDVRRVPFFIGHYPTRSELAVPLMAPHVIGVINLESRNVDHFSQHDEQLLTIASATVASAVQRSCERARESQWQDRFTGLAELHRLAAAARDEASFLQELSERIVRLFPEFHICVIRLHDEAKGMLALMGVAGRDHSTSVTKSFEQLVPVRSSISGHAIESGEPEISPDVQSDARFFREKLAVARGLRSMVVAPIVPPADARPLGSVAVFSTSVETRFQDEHRKLLDDIARFLAIVLTNLRQRERLRIQDEVMATTREAVRARATLDRICEIVVRKTGAQGALVYLAEEARVWQKGLSGEIPESLRHDSYMVGSGPVGVVAESGSPIRILDPASTDERATYGAALSTDHPPQESLLVVPIHAVDHPGAARLGVIVAVGVPRHGFSHLDQEIVEEIAVRLGAAIAREQDVDALAAALLDSVRDVAEISRTLMEESECPDKRLDDLRTISLHCDVVVRALAETRDLREIHPNLTVTMRPESLLSIIDAAVATNRSLATLSDVTIVVENGFADLMILADRHRMEQAFTSLIENAVRYADRNTHVRIFHYGNDGVSCTTCIQDFGLHIEDAEREKIFESRYRSPAAKARLGYGSGIGLSTARVIVTQLHRGAIRVTSVPDANRIGVADVRFYIDLRMSPPATSSATPESRDGR